MVYQTAPLKMDQTLEPLPSLANLRTLPGSNWLLPTACSEVPMAKPNRANSSACGMPKNQKADLTSGLPASRAGRRRTLRSVVGLPKKNECSPLTERNLLASSRLQFNKSSSHPPPPPPPRSRSSSKQTTSFVI